LGTRFRTACREEKGGNTWWALFAGEKVGTWRRAAVAAAVAHPVVADRARVRRQKKREAEDDGN